MIARLRGAAAAALACFVVGCGGGPSTPSLSQLSMVVGGGDGQFGTAGQVLTDRLQVVVTAASSGSPRKDVGVLWTVVSGDASFTTSAATLTDASGSAFATVRLGSTPGDVVIRATATEQSSATVTFTVHLVDRPQLQGLSTATAVAGETIVVDGLNFSPSAEQNVVLFSGIRGRVVSSSTTRLSVEVPDCLPTRQVDVTAQLGTLASNALTLSVAGGTSIQEMNVGEVLDVADDGGFTCLRLSGGPDVAYLAVTYSTSTVAAAQHGFELTGLTGAAPTQQANAATPARAESTPPPRARPDLRRVHEAFEGMLRARESELVRTGARVRTGAARQPSIAAVPQQGEERTFSVLNADNEFDQVEAVAEYIGGQVALYVEKGATGFTESDLASFAARFDDVIYPTVTGAFGTVSDLDGNERVAVLFTSTVNRLTPKGTTGGFVGGFFFGIDLLPDRQGSNNGEVFYTLVPDPNGAYSDPRTVEKLLEIVPAILAHEFQHMVHFNERILVLEAEANEALWLSEGLAQMAEELVAQEYESQGDADDADLFRGGNRARARRYLQDPSGVSLIVTSGHGTLEERGGGWLYMLYLTQRAGESVLGQLVRTTRIGVDNVTSRLGAPWESLLADWWSAAFLDAEGGTGNLEYAGVDLASLLGAANYSLSPESVGSSDFSRSGSLWSASARYYIVVPSLQSTVSLRLGGEAGGVSAAGAGLRLRVIRYR